jgi:hypothetical protein
MSWGELKGARSWVPSGDTTMSWKPPVLSLLVFSVSGCVALATSKTYSLGGLRPRSVAMSRFGSVGLVANVGQYHGYVPGVRG